MFRKMIVIIRNWYLVNIKWSGYTFGDNFHAGRNVFIWAKQSITIGNNCYIGRNSQIECNTIIGDNVLIANNVAFVGKYDHNYQQIGVSVRQASQVQDNDYDWLEVNRKIVIGDDVWIGYGAIVLSGVKIESGCIIAAGAIITKDTDSYGVYAGVPAKRIANRFDQDSDLTEHLKLLNKD